MKTGDNMCRICVSGIKRYRVLSFILDKGIECSGITEKNEELCITTHISNKKTLTDECKRLDCEVRLADEGSGRGHRLAEFLLLHSGLLTGLIISVVLCSIFSQMILRINIENDSEQVRADIMSVLDENGLHIGSFKGGFDYLKLERELKGKVNGISWAGISVQGNTLVIDTIDNIPKPKTDSRRLPCNVVALHDCVVDKAEVFCGDLSVTIGSGVMAGDILISGTRKKLITSGKDDKETEVTEYMRASGNVYGTFVKKAEFFFPYEQAVNTPTGKTKDVSYLNIFDTDIPLFFGDIKGNYSYTAERKPLKLFGFELPLAVTDVEYSEYTEAINTYTDEDIEQQMSDSIKRFEADFLSDYEIKDMKKTSSKDSKGVTMTLEYTLYGEISEQVDIYLNKQ